MKTTDFYQKLTSAKLLENLEKQFGTRVKLENYNREQLEDIRNKLRTRVFQQESSAGINDLLTNETYQKDKAMLELLNTRIKEMLGENIKQLRDKMDQLSEAKKPAKLADKDYDGDGEIESEKDEVWGSRFKAAKKAGKMKEASVAEGFDDMEKALKAKDEPKPSGGAGKKAGKSYGGTAQKPAKAKDDDKDLDEAAPSAGMTAAEKSAVVKKAKAGADIGKPGKGFEKVEKAAAKGGAKDPKAVAAAAMWKAQAKKAAAKESTETFRRNVRMVNESLGYLLAEDEEGKAKAITAASDMVNDFTSWMQRVGQYQTKSMIELADAIKADFGVEEAMRFKEAVGPSLAATLEVLTAQREAISNAVSVLAGEAVPETPMGTEPEMDAGMDTGMEPEMEPVPDEMNVPPADEFAASDAAAGAGSAGREMRESAFARKLSESHSIMNKLAR